MSYRKNRGNKILTKDLEVNLHMMGQEAARRLTVAQFISWQFLQICLNWSSHRLYRKLLAYYLLCFFAIPTIFIGSIIGRGGDDVDTLGTGDEGIRQGSIPVVTI